jgi:formamidopyrimidine-DNA glycosylase
MPELPEVETIARYLRLGTSEAPPITNRRILGARLFWERTLAEPAPLHLEEFALRLTGQEILTTGRRGKFLLIQLSEDVLIFHLRMSGDLLVRPAHEPPAPHDRLVLYLDGDLQLAFNDTRKFGRAWLVKDPEQVLRGLGPEPLDPAFTAQDLYDRLQSYRRQLKPLLLDQRFIAGMGNIYSDEALYLARLHPLTLSNTLTLTQAERLWQSMRFVLSEGIRLHGASIDWVYRGGDFQNYFQVYKRTGEDCRECGSPIQRILVGQRSTHFCPRCQPPP